MSDQQLKLYESSGSPNSRRVRIFLAEKGISVTRVPVDLGAKEQFSEAYTKINPRRVVPTLVLEDGTAIGEVPAILRYLEETHPNTPLLGTSPKEKALVTMWSAAWSWRASRRSWKPSATPSPGSRGARLPARMTTSKSRPSSTAAASVWRIFYADLEARLSDAAFVGGDRFSVADITAVVTVDFATRALSLAIPEGNVATQRWYGIVAARPQHECLGVEAAERPAASCFGHHRPACVPIMDVSTVPRRCKTPEICTVRLWGKARTPPRSRSRRAIWPLSRTRKRSPARSRRPPGTR